MTRAISGQPDVCFSLPKYPFRIRRNDTAHPIEQTSVYGRANSRADLVATARSSPASHRMASHLTSRESDHQPANLPVSHKRGTISFPLASTHHQASHALRTKLRHETRHSPCTTSFFPYIPPFSYAMYTQSIKDGTTCISRISTCQHCAFQRIRIQ